MNSDVQTRTVGDIRFIQSSQTPTVWVCQVCGGAVADYIKHAQWHGNLRGLLASAGIPFTPGVPLQGV